MATRFLCSTQLSYSITHLVFSKASFDPRPLEPVSVLATYPLIIITRKDLPVNNLKEFLDLREGPSGKVNYGNQGVANTGHLLGELMMLKGNFKMTGVFYRGSDAGDQRPARRHHRHGPGLSAGQQGQHRRR